jgi:hypothetical protein
MEAVGFHYIVSRRILFQLRDVKRLRHYAVSHPDLAKGGAVLGLVDRWLEAFQAENLTHDLDEKAFSVTGDALDLLVSICPESPTLGQLAAGEAQGTVETEFRETLRDFACEIQSENETKNFVEPLERNQPWFCQPLNQIARSFWWICRVIESPQDGLITVYGDGFPQLKCKFRPRVGSKTNMFEVVSNAWSHGVQAAWEDWTPGSLHSLDQFIAAMGETRRLVNGKWNNWDDGHKVFIPTPHGDSLVLGEGDDEAECV